MARLNYEEKKMLDDVEDFIDIDYAIDCMDSEELKAELELYAYCYYYRTHTPKEIAQAFIEDFQ